MRNGWPDNHSATTKSLLTPRQVDGLMWALKLRMSLSATPREAMVIQQDFISHYIPAEILDADGNFNAEMNRLKLYGRMPLLEAAQYFHYNYVLASRGLPAAGDGKPMLQEVTQDYAADRQTNIQLIWKARQLADAIGTPYDAYIDTVIKHHLAGSKAAKQIPLRLFATPKAHTVVKASLTPSANA
jgi:hypothetical protein